MATTLERIEDLEKSVKILSEQIGMLKNTSASNESDKMAAQLNELANLANNRSLSLEVSLTELAKTMTAIAAELTEHGVISSKGIMDRIIKMNQDEDDKELNNLIDSKILTQSSEVKPYSFVITSHTVVNINEPEQSQMVMERRLLRLPTPLVSDKLKEDLIGRKVGDQIQINKEQDGHVHVLTIKEIYDLNEQELIRKGEEQLNVSEDLQK